MAPNPASEHLFVIKSVIGLYKQMGKTLMLQLWDISKYFDRESLADGLNEFYKNNVRGKICKLVHKMNKDTRIKVRTPNTLETLKREMLVKAAVREQLREQYVVL